MSHLKEQSSEKKIAETIKMNSDSEPEQLNFEGDENIEEQADTSVSERNTELNDDYYMFQEDRNRKRKPNLPIENFRHKNRKSDSDELLVLDVSGDEELDEISETAVSADKAAEEEESAESNNNTQSTNIIGDRHPAEMIECETDTSNVRNVEYQMQRKRTYEGSHGEEHDTNKKRKSLEESIDAVTLQMNTSSISESVTVHRKLRKMRQRSRRKMRKRLWVEYRKSRKNNRLLVFKNEDGEVVGSTETTVSEMSTVSVPENATVHVESSKKRLARLWREFNILRKSSQKSQELSSTDVLQRNEHLLSSADTNENISLEESIEAVTHQLVTSSISESVTVRRLQRKMRRRQRIRSRRQRNRSHQQREVSLWKEFLKRKKNNRLLFFKNGDGEVVGSTETTESQMDTVSVPENVTVHVENRKQRRARVWREYRICQKILRAQELSLTHVLQRNEHLLSSADKMSVFLKWTM